MSIRNAAKAIIINGDKILLNKCHNEFIGDYFCLAGGGQNQYETMAEAVQRECLEETGYDVTVYRFAAIFEMIYDFDKLKSNSDYTHKIYNIFICHIDNKAINIPTEIDTNQLGYEWIAINDLNKINLQPKTLGENITQIINSTTPIYLGSERTLCEYIV